MSLLGKFLKTGLDLGIGLPAAIVKDVVTMGGAMTDQIDKGHPYTFDAVKRIAKDAGEVRDEIDEL